MAPSDTGPVPELIDPFGGPDDELDPDIYPDPTADDPPFGDEPADDDDPHARFSSPEQAAILVPKDPPTSIRVYMRPPTDAGLDGLADEQVEEMAEIFIQKLIDENPHASPRPILP